MLSTAFKNPDEVFAGNLIPLAPTLENFLYVFTQLDFLRYLLNTFFVASSVTIISTPSGALRSSRKSRPAKS